MKNRITRKQLKKVIEHDYTLWVTLSESIIENYVRRLPSGEITMTSLTVCKKTSLSRKWCMIETTLVLNTDRKSVSPFQLPLLRTVHSAPIAEIK